MTSPSDGRIPCPCSPHCPCTFRRNKCYKLGTTKRDKFGRTGRKTGIKLRGLEGRSDWNGRLVA